MQWHFRLKAKKSQKEGMVGVYETPVGISAVYSVIDNTTPIIKAAVFEAADTITAKQAVLAKFVIAHALQGVDCAYVLGSGEYSLNLVESPLVAVSEMPEAMRWVLRDLIDFPINEAVIDTFALPFLRAKDNVKMLYAAVMRKQIIEKIETLIKPSGLILKFIDIPELVLKNILTLQPQFSKGCAFVQLDPKGGKLILYRDEQICMTRSFDLKLGALGQDPAFDAKILESLALEFQRSFDYMNSVFRQNIQNLIILAPTLIDQNLISESLKTNLGSETDFLKLVEILKFDRPTKTDEEINFLFAVGATLRTEEKTL